MAIGSTIEYCTNEDLQDTYPISKYDLKRTLYNFVDIYNATIEKTLFINYNSGLVSSLFVNGIEQAGKQTIGTRDRTTINNESGYSATDLSIVVDSGAALAGIVETYIKIGEEILFLTRVQTNLLTVLRGQLGTTAAPILDGTGIVTHFNPSSNKQWLYDQYNDFIVCIIAENPSNNIIEAGDDWIDIKTRFRRKASRLVESELGSSISREILKDREGNYPTSIIRLVSLKAVILFVKSHNPLSPDLIPLQLEYNTIIDKIKSGKIIISGHGSGDDSKGIIREIVVDKSSDLFPVELRGFYTGSNYELIKIIVTSVDETIIGTATFSTYGKSNTTLKNQILVSDEKINGDFQSLGVEGLYVRWGGDDSATAKVYQDDEYELELWGSNITPQVSQIKSISISKTKG